MNIKDKLAIEKSELQEKVDRLTAFLDSDAAGALTEHHKALLKIQRTYMVGYACVLQLRIEDLVRQNVADTAA